MYTTIDCGNYTFEHSASLEVYDIIGKMVDNVKFSFEGNKIILEESKLDRGLYFYKVYDGKTMISTGKIIIQLLKP